MAKTLPKSRAQEGVCTLMVLLAATLWGSSGIFVHTLNAAGFSGTQITVTRLCSVPVMTALWLGLTDRAQLRIVPADIKWFALNGAAGVFLFSLLYAISIEYVGMATAAVLIYLMPSLVMLFSVLFLGEHFTPRKGVCLVLSLAGCALVSGLASGFVLQPVGLAAGLSAAGCYTVYNILLSTKLRRYSALTNVLYSGIFAALFSLSYTAFSGELAALPGKYAAQPTALLLNILMGLVCSVTTYFLYNTAVRTISASRAAIIATFEPVAAALLGMVLYQEKPDLFAWLGIGCEVTALVLLQLPAPVRIKQS